MKSLEYVKKNISTIDGDILDQRFTKRFMYFLPTDEWGQLGYEYVGKKTFIPKEWTEENILKQLKEDVEFGIEKATNHRGISASLMYEVCKSWCIVLENGLENTEYGWYGDNMFKTLDKYYNFGLVKENTFDDDFYKSW